MSGARAYEVAQRIGYPTRLVARLLAELEADGLVVRDGGGYRISEYAEAAFGQAFRDLCRDLHLEPKGGAALRPRPGVPTYTA